MIPPKIVFRAQNQIDGKMRLNHQIYNLMLRWAIANVCTVRHESHYVHQTMERMNVHKKYDFAAVLFADVNRVSGPFCS